MTWARITGLVGALAVGAGAFGAHGLRDLVTPERLQTWQTAAQYHLVHAVVLLVLVARAEPARLAASFILAGVLLFSGSLYALVAFDQPWLGAITPLGGVSFIIGWILGGWALRPPRQV